MMEKKISVIQADWSAPSHIVAFTTTRIGGISSKPYDTLNLAEHVGDDVGDVKENRRRLKETLLLPNEPCWLDQVHGSHVVKANTTEETLHAADASWTDQAGVVCAVMTADCLPLVITDKAGTKVAVVHGGWRSLAQGILQKTLEALAIDPIHLVVWMGPAIGPEKFEVGTEVRDAFLAQTPRAQAAFIPKPGAESDKWFADLFLLARILLSELGVNDVSGGGLCTYTHSAQFYSYRREKITGRMATCIYINGK